MADTSDDEPISKKQREEIRKDQGSDNEKDEYSLSDDEDSDERHEK